MYHHCSEVVDGSLVIVPFRGVGGHVQPSDGEVHWGVELGAQEGGETEPLQVEAEDLCVCVCVCACVRVCVCVC